MGIQVLSVNMLVYLETNICLVSCSYVSSLKELNSRNTNEKIFMLQAPSGTKELAMVQSAEQQTQSTRQILKTRGIADGLKNDSDTCIHFCNEPKRVSKAVTNFGFTSHRRDRSDRTLHLNYFRIFHETFLHVHYSRIVLNFRIVF